MRSRCSATNAAARAPVATRTQRRVHVSAMAAVTDDSAVSGVSGDASRGHSYTTSPACVEARSSTATRSAVANGRAKTRTVTFAAMGRQITMPSAEVRLAKSRSPPTSCLSPRKRQYTGTANMASDSGITGSTTWGVPKPSRMLCPDSFSHPVVMNTRPTISRIALSHPRSTGAERPRASSDFSSVSSLARATVHIILNISRGVAGCSHDAGGPYWTKQRIRGHLTPVRYSSVLRCILSVKPRTCPTQRRTVTGSTCLFSRDCCLPSPSCWSSRAHDPVTIREARQHLLRTHGIRISRATFRREFMADATQVTTVWCGALAQRGRAVAWIFSVESVDRMAVAFRSRRVEAQPMSESLSSAVTRFGERRPAKKRRRRTAPAQCFTQMHADRDTHRGCQSVQPVRVSEAR